MGRENKFLRWVGQTFNGSQLVALSFMLLIFSGALLFMLPISTQDRHGLTFLDALFTATSASCVTGLTVIDVGNELSLFGQIVLIGLIQIGGLGIMTMTTLVMVIAGRKVSLRERLFLQESMNQTEISGVVRIALNIIKYTLIIELFFGTIMALYFMFVKGLGIKGVYFGYWHSVSAFCNAGFDLMGDYKSLIDYRGDVLINVCIMLLITLGGLGFVVLEDLHRGFKWKRFALQTKIVLLTTLGLNVIGTILIWLFEANNPYTIGNLPQKEAFLASLFQTVSARTAGFNTSVWTMLRGKRDVVMFGRRIDEKIVDKSFVITVLCLLWVIIAVMILVVLSNGEHSFIEILFEVMSGFGTVGLGIGITPGWEPLGKLVLILTMYIGRIGILTFLLSFLSAGTNKIRYPSEHINIG